MEDIQCSPLAWHTQQIPLKDSARWKVRVNQITASLITSVCLFISYFGINFRFFSSNQEATHFRLAGFRRNLLELLYLKSCQRKHGESGGRAGGSEQTQAALGHTHGASCTQKAWWQHIHLSPALKCSSSESWGWSKEERNSQSQFRNWTAGPLPGMWRFRTLANDSRSPSKCS